MSSVLPELVDAWRMVSARRIFESRVRLNAMPRLATYLADAEGECDYTFEFGRDALGIAFLDVQASASLPLINSANSFSNAVGAPKLKPLPNCACTASRI